MNPRQLAAEGRRITRQHLRVFLISQIFFTATLFRYPTTVEVVLGIVRRRTHEQPKVIGLDCSRYILERLRHDWQLDEARNRHRCCRSHLRHHRWQSLGLDQPQ